MPRRKKSYVIRTPRGVITSFREAWKDWADRPIYTWRTDRDQPPHDFGSYKAAKAFLVSVWCCSSTRREIAERDSWIIEEVSASHG